MLRKKGLNKMVEKCPELRTQLYIRRRVGHYYSVLNLYSMINHCVLKTIPSVII